MSTASVATPEVTAPSPVRSKPGRGSSAIVARVIRYAVLLAFIIVVVMPLYVLLVTTGAEPVR